VARTESDLLSLAAEAEGRITPWVDDVLGAAFYDRIEALDRLDILVNNAGGNKPMLMTDVDDATLDHLIALNIRSAYKTAQSAARVMQHARQGVIVNMSSQMGHVGSPRRTVYCMSKHAIEGLTKAMAVELAPDGIRVVAVAPTFVLTPMTAGYFDDPAFKAMVMDMIPLRQLASPQDVADAVVFLASDKAGMITGDSLKIDGGWTAR
jgi:NAD(P)-dependent dehydrogenase (short-subunit alcohol dehydrogenase family)